MTTTLGTANPIGYAFGVDLNANSGYCHMFTMPDGGQVTKIRLWNPANYATATGQTEVSGQIWIRDFPGTVVYFDIPMTDVAHWAEVELATPYIVDSDEDVIVEVMTPTGHLSSKANVLPITTTGLVAAGSGFRNGESQHANNPGAILSGTASYAIDVDAEPAPVLPPELSVTRVSETTANIQVSAENAPFGIDVWRAAGEHTVDGEGRAFGDEGYDPATITGITLVFPNVTDPSVLDSTLDPETVYTYAAVRATFTHPV